MVGARILLDEFLVQEVVNGHVAILLGHKQVLAEEGEMLNAPAHVESPGEQEALRVIPLEIVTLLVIGEELLVAESEESRVCFHFLLLLRELQRFLLELFEIGLVEFYMLDRLLRSPLQDCAHLLVLLLEEGHCAGVDLQLVQTLPALA